MDVERPEWRVCRQVTYAEAAGRFAAEVARYGDALAAGVVGFVRTVERSEHGPSVWRVLPIPSSE